MSTHSDSRHLTPGRRAACDRCRAQKLRCVRDPSGASAKCERCTALEAMCNFGIPKPAGRPPAARRTRDHKQGIASSRSHPGGTVSQSPSLGMNTSVTEASGLSMSPIQSRLNGSISGPGQVLSTGPSDLLLPIASSPTFDENTSLPGVFDVDLMNLDASSLATPRNFPVPCVPQPNFPWTPLPSVMSGHPSICIQTSGAQPTNFSDPFSGLDVHDPDIDRHTSNGVTESRWTHQGDEISGPNLNANGEPGVRNLIWGGNSHTVPQHRIQRLSELGVSLYRIFAESSGLRQEIDGSEKLAHFPDEFAGKLLENSMAFLDLLRSFQQPGEEAPLHTALERDQHGLRLHGFESSPSTNSDLSETSFNSPIRNPNTSDSAKPRDRGPQWRVDMTVVLQLIACYLRITQLHSILYAAIYHYVISLPQDFAQFDSSYQKNTDHSPFMSQQPPIFPGLQIGGVALEGFGSFQIKLILQISAHILGEIETALALPEGYRVSRKRDDETYGVLGFSIPPQFFEMTMADHESAGPQGGGQDARISGSRARLGKLRMLLKGTINI